MLRITTARFLESFGVDSTGLPGGIYPVEYFHTIHECAQVNWRWIEVAIQQLQPSKEEVHAKGDLAFPVYAHISNQMKRGRTRGSVIFNHGNCDYHGWWKLKGLP